MVEARLWGDPFAAGPESRALRRFLAAASAAGVRVGICLSCLRDGGGRGRRAVSLTDGARAISVRTDLEGSALAEVLVAARRPVRETAPLVVFAADAREAGLEFPLASLVIPWHEDECVLLARVLKQLELPTDPASEGVAEAELARWLALPEVRGTGVIVHPGGEDPRLGTDLAIAAFARAGRGELLIVHEPGASPSAPTLPPGVRRIEGPLEPGLLAGADAVLLPVRAAPPPGDLARLAAAGRPLIVSRFSATAEVLARPGLCWPIGGRYVGGRFEPDVRAVEAALVDVARLAPRVREVGERARAHVVATWAAPRLVPAPTPRPSGRRPLVVLEAPLLETSSSSALTVATARALRRRGRVDVALVAVAPFRSGPDSLPADVRPLVTRGRPRADLWLSAGWPPRTARPPTACFAVRLDWEYGALPLELTPVITEEADRVIVHSVPVRRAVVAAGRSPATVDLLPHGVDAEVFHPGAAPLRRVLAFKGDRRALLFAGGPVWRKGFDLLLRAVCSAFSPRDPVCLVIKTVGVEDAYFGYDLTDLARRVAAAPEAIDVLLLEEDLTESEMAGVYTACDALLHPYRGEGFGLPVLEARACGLPVVVTAGGSTDDFCDGGACLRIEARRRLVDLPGVHVSRPWVLEPDADVVAGLAREVVERCAELRAVARAEASAIARRHTWDRAAAALEDLAWRAVGLQVASPV